MNPYDHIAVSLLLLFGFVLSTGAGLVWLACYCCRRLTRAEQGVARRKELPAPAGISFHSFPLQRPACWLAIRSRRLPAVQSALALHDAEPCSWIEGLVGVCDQKLFVSPSVGGWILIFGSGLPEPAEDVDRCFRFLLALSRKVGHVQLFSADRVLGHHAWIKVDSGRVLRAYAWAGRTLWNQGAMTREEAALQLKCFDYTATLQSTPPGLPEPIHANLEKIPLLAARWSIDPTTIDQRFSTGRSGVAGTLP